MEERQWIRFTDPTTGDVKVVHVNDTESHSALVSQGYLPDTDESGAARLYTQQEAASSVTAGNIGSQQQVTNTQSTAAAPVLPGGAQGPVPSAPPPAPTPAPPINAPVQAPQRVPREDRAALAAASFPDHNIPQAGANPAGDYSFEAQYNSRAGETGGWDNGYNPFEGTWAENEGQSVFNQIGSGQMTPDYAVHRMLGAQGLSNHGQQGYLEQMYELYPEYYKMLNPGANSLMPHEEYGIGGDYINELMGPSNGYAVLDPRTMWDNTFSGANDPQYQAAAAASDQPWTDQHQMVMQRVAALSPIIGQDNAIALMNQTDLLWRQYQDMQNSGRARQDYSFIDFMRDNGAGDWF